MCFQRNIGPDSSTDIFIYATVGIFVVKISPLIRSNVEEKNGRINNIMENNSFLALYRML